MESWECEYRKSGYIGPRSSFTPNSTGSLRASAFFHSAWAPRVLLLVLAYIPVFHQLNTEPVKTFDESLFALRAYWLAETGQYLNNFSEFPEGPSATNLKTPLFTAVQALSFRLFGYNELALRLPVALCVLGIFALLLLMGRHLGSEAWGAWAVVVLLATEGLFHAHAARTGDHDVPLALFLLLSAWGLYRWVETRSPAWIWLAAGATWAAMMTKGVAGGFWLPGMALYLSWQKAWGPLLRQKHTWMAAASVLLLLLAYYGYRELDRPGFLAALWKGELGGHYLAVHDGHDWPWYWFVVRLMKDRFAPWLLWLPFSWAVMALPQLRPFRAWLGLLLAVSLSHLVIISASATKLEWYDVPLFAPMAMMLGSLLWGFWQVLLRAEPEKVWLRVLVMGGLLLALWLPPYLRVLDKQLPPRYLDYPGERFAGLMRQSERVYPNIRQYTLLHSLFSTHALFYKMVYNDHKGFEIREKSKVEELVPGEVIMVCEAKLWEDVQKQFIVEPLTTKDGCYLAHVVGEVAEEEAGGTSGE